ncbi:MAG TPA: hypothetical protein VFH27_14205 [Longimicrobiaceae bacterium]|nr:hypothetical protein [Longimicrobiaceae bacterium]
MPRRYRAVLNVDYTGQSSNEYQYLISALIQAGWTYVETSSLILDTPHRNEIWRGISLITKQDSSIPQNLSALTLHIQGSNDFDSGIDYPYSDTHPNALANVSLI